MLGLQCGSAHADTPCIQHAPWDLEPPLPPRPGKCEFGHCKFWAFSGPGSLGRSQQQPHGCGPVWLGSQSIRLVLLYSDLGRLVVLNLLVFLFDMNLFDQWIGTPGEHMPARGPPAALGPGEGADKARAAASDGKKEPGNGVGSGRVGCAEPFRPETRKRQGRAACHAVTASAFTASASSRPSRDGGAPRQAPRRRGLDSDCPGLCSGGSKLEP